MLADDIKAYNSEVEKDNRGLVYLIGFLVVLLIGVVKDILLIIMMSIRHLMVSYYEIFIEPSKHKTEYNKHLFYNKSYKDTNKYVDVDMEYIGFLNSLKNNNENYYNTDEYLDLYKRNRKEISEYSILLRNTLLKSRGILRGCILKTEYPKIPLEYLKDSKVYMVQHITFEEDINKALSYLFKIDLIRDKKTKESYLIINNGETIELEEKLKNYLMSENISIRLFDTSKIIR